MTFASPDGAQLKRLLRQEFDPRSITRGAAYFRGGRVLKVEIEQVESVFLVNGDVQGTARRPYVAVLELLHDDSGFVLLNDYCNCPLGGGCKHAVALLLAVAERLTSAPRASVPAPSTGQWDQWLQATPAPPPATVGRSADQRLGFVLDVDRQLPLPTLTVQPIWLHRLHNGGWGKPEPWPSPSSRRPARPLDLEDPEHALVAALRMQPMLNPKGNEAYRLDDARGDSLLQALLDQQWCCWQKPRNGVLGHGEPMPLHWHWRLQPDGSQRLLADGVAYGAPEASEGLTLLRAGGRLWYLDPTRQVLGHVDHDLELAQRLLQMPALAPEHVAHVSAQWQRQPALATLSPPLPVAPSRNIGGPPAPVLTLSVAKPDPEARGAQAGWYRQRMESAPAMFLAHLQFDYAGHRVDAEWPVRPERRLVDGRLLLIERDARGERDAAERLLALGLQPAQEHRLLAWPMADCVTASDWLLHDPADWLDSMALPALGAALEAAGVRVELAADYPIELLGEPDAWYGELEESSGADWFGVELGIQIGDERVSLLPILARALEDPHFALQPTADESPDAVWLAPLDARRRVPLPLRRVRAMLAPLLEWISPHALRDGAPLRVPRLAADALVELQSPAGAGLVLGGGAAAQALADRLRQAGRDLPLQAPTGLLATPRPYQLDGLRWLQFLADARLGGVLADDMGLGKTLQVLMHLLAEKQRQRLPQPALVVCPTSVVGNWCDQAARFTPDLRVLVLHGSDRAAHFDRIGDHDLVITTYALLPRDREALLAQRFTIVVFDEAQAIKNPRSQAAQVARVIPAQRRLAVTGTPVENHLGELWAQMDCVLPGLLGDARHFARHYRTPIEKHGDADRQAQLHRRIAPFMLRRDKEAVAPELPAKTIIEHKIELAGRQRELYETLRLAMHGRVREALATRGLAQSSIVVLDALLKLRQACCDPRLVKLDGKARPAGTAPPSAKLDVLLPMLDELVDEGRRILLFSQFTGMLDLIEAEVQARGLGYVRLDGSTRDRATPIRRFQAGEVPLFLISLKAGGVGLNLTAADTVIHYDPWWNPAVESQATDRAHRIGQDKPVFVYKLICTGTVEEKIQGMQRRKAGLAEALLGGGTRASLQFDEADIEALFAPA